MKINGKNAYVSKGISCLILCAVLVSAGIAFSLPKTAGAYWPFTITRADSIGTPVLHDASMALLAAPLSTNVDDVIDPSSLTTPDGSALVPGGIIGTSTPDSADSSAAPDSITVPTNSEISQYTVKAGDSLSQIAENFGVSVNTILWANDITDPSTIKQGTVLVILPVSGVQHTVRSGETLSSIAAKYNGNAADIAQFNGISADTALQVGSVIIIPGGELPNSSDSSANTKFSSGSSSSPSGASKKPHTTTSSSKDTETESSSSGSSSKLTCDYASGNPCHGIDGAPLRGFFTNPLPSGALVSQGLHGWDAVDLAVPAGTAIHAAASGTVILSRMGGWNGGYGNYVILDNGSGVETLYAHMTQTAATVGDTVSAGEVIGYVGMTGDATGNHLHFEVRGAQNPFAFCSENMNSNDCFNP